MISYGSAPSPNTDRIMVERIGLGYIITGIDSFGSLSTYKQRFHGELQTGEVPITQDGSKTSVKEAWLRTYTLDDSGSPAYIIQARATDELTWADSGDKNGTITVDPVSCTGSSTAWSNVVLWGNGSTTAITLPCLATQARVFIGTNGVETATTAYTVTGVREITMTSAPSTSQYIAVYWDNEPYIRMRVGDFIETSEGFHRILSINTATDLTLDWYPHEERTGYHRPAKKQGSGDWETVLGLNHSVDAMQFRFLIFPRKVTAASPLIDVVGYSIVHVPGGPRVLKAQR
jgi:hypothetical protein